MMRSRKGSFIDVIGVVIAIFIIIVLLVAIGIAYKSTGDALEDTKPLISSVDSFNESADLVIDNGDKYPAFWDFLIVLLAFGLWIGLAISSWILGNNPVFLVTYVILMVILLIFGVVMEFVGEEFIENAAMAPHFVDYPITSFLLNNFLIYTLFIIVSTGVLLYLKFQDSGGVPQ